MESGVALVARLSLNRQRWGMRHASRSLKQRQLMPRYRFRLSIFERLLDPGDWLELPDRDAAVRKAHQIAQALLSVADQRVPWEEGMVVVQCNDGSQPMTLPIIDIAVGEAKATWH